MGQPGQLHWKPMSVLVAMFVAVNQGLVVLNALLTFLLTATPSVDGDSHVINKQFEKKIDEWCPNKLIIKTSLRWTIMVANSTDEDIIHKFNPLPGRIDQQRWIVGLCINTCCTHPTALKSFKFHVLYCDDCIRMNAHLPSAAASSSRSQKGLISLQQWFLKGRIFQGLYSKDMK